MPRAPQRKHASGCGALKPSKKLACGDLFRRGLRRSPTRCACRAANGVRKPCCARLPKLTRMSSVSEYSSECCGPPNLPGVSRQPGPRAAKAARGRCMRKNRRVGTRAFLYTKRGGLSPPRVVIQFCPPRSSKTMMLWGAGAFPRPARFGKTTVLSLRSLRSLAGENPSRKTMVRSPPGERSE